MIVMRQLILAGCAATIVSIGTAQAGPCNTATGQTTGTAKSVADEHPPTSPMNKRADQQTSGRPTPGQHAQDPEPSAKMTDQDQPKDAAAASQQVQSAESSEKITKDGC